ncbi:hypothetical protein [Allomesorhizobium camelthorni]|uniref:Uncharacterized protein n=1 Tax=Allomesorhizobium camelthorni TaxID=475069 RepID=A0A6G4W6E7_9HYPH|nr:hypothetical protein [Mesorhizobium camelthorni]NGO49747.1 hypothetical protein [Mesorhizobium camelthorni]
MSTGSALPKTAASAEPASAKPSLLWTICAVIGVFALIGQFTGNDKKAAPSASVSVLDQAAAVFQGSYTREQIKRALDEVMALHGVPRIESEYDRWTNVLVAMRQDGGGTEMEILRCIKAMGTTAPFPTSAGLCATGRKVSVR